MHASMDDSQSKQILNQSQELEDRYYLSGLSDILSASTFLWMRENPYVVDEQKLRLMKKKILILLIHRGAIMIRGFVIKILWKAQEGHLGWDKTVYTLTFSKRWAGKITGSSLLRGYARAWFKIV